MPHTLRPEHMTTSMPNILSWRSNSPRRSLKPCTSTTTLWPDYRNSRSRFTLLRYQNHIAGWCDRLGPDVADLAQRRLDGVGCALAVQQSRHDGVVGVIPDVLVHGYLPEPA